LDERKYKNFGVQDEVDEQEDVLHFKAAGENIPHDKDLEVKTYCDNCAKFLTFPGFYNSNGNTGLICPVCH